RGAAPALAVLLGLLGCGREHRVGDFVWVEWEGREYPAYVIDVKDRGRLRVHYDGYEARWDEDVTLDRVRGLVEGTAVAPPPPDRVARAMGQRPRAVSSAGAPSPFALGQRLRVRWRGSLYPATVVGLPGPGKVTVHYDGYGAEWDEVVDEERVAVAR
ncbi:MAG: hypothetical protein FJ104_06000, partial [Deltaproteobacteria bacterium]|nr:hypothetical protein [Deltaproteobacteria bacterium]